MAQAAPRPPPYLQPRPKANPTFSSHSIVARSAASTPPLATPVSQSRQPSPSRSSGTVDVSDAATAALVRRVLCPQSSPSDRKPVDELLPSLTSSNDVDLQLYAIIAIIIKDLVNSWYGKITLDQTFVEEIVRIIAHCSRALESRLRTVDLETLVLDEIPGLVKRHVHRMPVSLTELTYSWLIVVVYRLSHDGSHSSMLPIDPRIIYHELSPHPALSPVPTSQSPSSIEEQTRNEAVYRQLLVQGALAILLPTEDLENACLRTLVADVIAEVILGNAIGDKACEPRFIWTTLSTLVAALDARIRPRASGESMKKEPRGRLEEFGLLSVKERTKPGEASDTRRFVSSSVFWRGLQFCYLGFIALRFILVGVFTASSRPLRSSTVRRRRETSSAKASTIEHRTTSTKAGLAPILRFRILSLISTLLSLPRRSPWLHGSLALLQHHLVDGWFHIAAVDGIFDQ